MKKLVLATRKSALALAQTRAFAARLVAANPGLEIEELHITTSGDRFVDQKLQDIGGKGLFIKELEEALLDGRADFAVHSIKDVPAELAPRLTIACVPEREDPRDAIVTKTGGLLAALPQHATVGTSSLRRAVALQRFRPDLTIEPLRGNVDTRLRKVKEGPYDAVVLALAGLRRLGRDAEATEILSTEICLPAVGQGALGIECRAEDGETRAILAKLAHPETATRVTAERAVMAAVGGNCRMPIAAHAERRTTAEGEELRLEAFVADSDGNNLRSAVRSIPWPTDDQLAHELGAAIGRELASSITGSSITGSSITGR